MFTLGALFPEFESTDRLCVINADRPPHKMVRFFRKGCGAAEKPGKKPRFGVTFPCN